MERTEGLESPAIFRKWAAISTIAATLEQKVWIQTTSPIFPNLYSVIVGHPGTGKTRSIRAAAQYYNRLPEPFSAPVSLTFASLVDALLRNKRQVLIPGQDPIEYNTMFIAADEFGAFIHKYDHEMTNGLSAFYDPIPYSQERRTNELKLKIASPQINMIVGSTPQHLMDFMPESAWGQGFTSRMIMVFSDERIIGDDFAERPDVYSTNLMTDLNIINTLHGQFHITPEYRDAVNNWRQLGEPPVPTHPRLIHYNTRRRVSLYKLSMVAAVDCGNALVLDVSTFNTAMGWLLEAESTMPDIFSAGVVNADAKAMDEIADFIKIAGTGKGISETRIIGFARDKIPLHSILRVVEIMERSGLIYCTGRDKRTQLKYYMATPPRAPDEISQELQ